MRTLLPALTLLLSLGGPLAAQAPASGATAPAPAAPNLKDLDAFVALLYTSISGPAGQKRDVDLQKRLFLPGARLAYVAHPKNGPARLVQMDVEGYCRNSFPTMEAHGFFEREIGRRVERFGDIVQIWSAYESWEQQGGPKARGINSFQLVFDGQRWWVSGNTWDEEGEGRALPGDLDPSSRATLTVAEAGTVDALVKNLYAFISGPAGKRDVAKIRALFHRDCRFTITGIKPDGSPGFRNMSVEDFLQRAVPSWEKGFIEHEAKRDVQQWGNMASVWTRYETSFGEGMKEHMRGINNLQLQFDGTRWWVMAIHFQNEDAKTKLPAL